MTTPTTPSTTAGPTALTTAQRNFSLIGVLLGLLLASLDQTIVATAGPIIQRDLHIPASHYTWLTTAYLVASTVMIPVYGKLSDLLGRKVIFLAGIAVFLLGSFLCGTAGNSITLIAFRAFQGLGAGALTTIAFTIIADLFAPAERGRYQGLFGAVFGLSSVAGPLLGGFLTDSLSWRWVFYVNLPVGLVALLVIMTRMPPLKQGSVTNRALDVAGVVWLILAVVPLLLAVSLGEANPRPGDGRLAWTSLPLLTLLTLGVVSLVGFIRTERRARDPVLNLALFRDRTFTLGVTSIFLLGSVLLAAVVFLPLFMVNVVGLSATNSGLTTTPLTLALVFASFVSGQLSSRLGRYKMLMLVSLGLLLIGFGVMAFTLTPHATQLEVTLKMILVGLGLGPLTPLYNLAVQNAATPDNLGEVTAAATFFRSLGSTVGVAIYGALYAGVVGNPPTPEGYTLALETVYRAGLVVIVLTLLLTLPLPNAQLRRTQADATSGAAAAPAK